MAGEVSNPRLSDNSFPGKLTIYFHPDDTTKSLATGRPLSFTLSFADCELPSDPDATLDEKGDPQPSCT